MADASIPIEISEDVVAELQRLLDDATIQVEDTSEIFIGVEDTSEREIPFAGVPDETTIGVEPTDERVIAVEDKTFTVDGTDFLDRLDTILTPNEPAQVEVPATEPETPAGSTLGLAQGSPTPTQAEIDFLSGLTGPDDPKGIAAVEKFRSVFWRSLCDSPGTVNIAIATEMPVNLAEGATESLAMAISGETLKVTPSGTSLPVSGDVGVTKLPPVSGSVGVTTLPPVVLAGPITISGPVSIAGTVPVRIEGGISQFLVDNEAQESTLGGATLIDG